MTPKQRDRLKQLSIQLQGPPSLRDMVVSGQLKLSPEQLIDIQSDIIQYVTANQFPIPPEALLASMPNNRVARTPEDLISPQMKAALMDMILKRLTPEQREKWNELTGPRFEAK